MVTNGISQCIKISNHYVVHLKVIQYSKCTAVLLTAAIVSLCLTVRTVR